MAHSRPRLRSAGPFVQAPRRVLTYLVRRLGWAAVSFVAVTLYTYVIFFVLPSNTVRNQRGFSTVQSGGLRDTGGTEGSFVREYGSFVADIVQFDLGTSRRTREPVTDVIARAAPATASLVIGAAVFWLLMAFPIGILSALRPRSLLDRAGMAFVLFGISVHPIWLSYVLAYVFGYRLGWFPIAGYCDVFAPTGACGGPVQWMYHLILPWFAFSLAFAAIYARMIRASLKETLDEDYVRTARAKGLAEWPAVRRHAMRNALLPIVTMLSMDLGLAFAAAVFVERAFGIPGIGSLLLAALRGRDMPVVIGIVVLVTLIIILMSALVDVAYTLIDPRVRAASRPEPTPEGEGRRAEAPRPAVSSPG
jgi:peptide/nickel transport system permease protein